MRISEIFSLDKVQAELDFVDINIKTDTPLFLDPFFLGIREDKWSHEASLTLNSFFQRLIDLIRDERESDALLLFRHLHEPNSTCLGLSQGSPEGNGVGTGDSENIFENILSSRAIQTGLIRDIEDSILFVDNFGKDKLSDMTTNIIRKHLIEYTHAQCELNEIELSNDVPSGFYWSRQRNEWVAEHTRMLVIEGKPILLVPKAIVSYSKRYTPDRYYNHFVLNFLQNEHLLAGSALVRERRSGARYVTKKDIKAEIGDEPIKEFLRRFTLDHPDVLDNFKNRTSVESLTNEELGAEDIPLLCQTLRHRLEQIQPGPAAASSFHKTILSILEILFYPYLMYPVKEHEIHDGRKRIDIVFDNAATSGIFRTLSEIWQLPCQYIFVECKNYSSDLNNPEIDQLSGRFSVNRGKVGIIVCRSFDNHQLFLQRCRDTYTDHRGLVIPLVDSDISTMLSHRENNDQEAINRYLSDIVRDVAAN